MLPFSALETSGSKHLIQVVQQDKKFPRQIL
jgi:hypothetical protein